MLNVNIGSSKGKYTLSGSDKDTDLDNSLVLDVIFWWTYLAFLVPWKYTASMMQSLIGSVPTEHKFFARGTSNGGDIVAGNVGIPALVGVAVVADSVWAE
jgi:hypothetical protein